jgi:glycosyltransferase involved in cell wall biosynthesis
VDKRRKKVGVIYQNNDAWVGGKYYLDCVISVLNNNSELFNVYIISKMAFTNFNMPVIKFNLNNIDRIINRLNVDVLTKIYLKIFGKNKLEKLMDFDAIFPAQCNIYFNALPSSKKIYWIPDFQENYYPFFFSKYTIINRLIIQVNAAYSKSKLVLSSDSVYKDFSRIFPKYCCNINIIPFVSSICLNNGAHISYETLNKKYNINKKYFICSNQFWIHKNHKILIEALVCLKKENINIKICLTGKEFDARNPNYVNQLKEEIKNHGLNENIVFLGFIPRSEQIALMKYSRAVIQPSLFEGWNTTIEDAKILGKIIIASNIEVHKEQLGEKGIFFDPNDSIGLAKILKCVKDVKNTFIEYSYHEIYSKYQKKIISLFS